MRHGDKPMSPRCLLGSIQPVQMDAEEIKRDAWNNQGILVLSIHDERLNWVDVELVKRLGEKVFGKLPNS